jgi:hypothetical protein
VSHKWHARPVKTPGHYFGSQGEARRFRDLELEQKAGELSGLHHHVVVIELAGAVSYRPDYDYTETHRGRWVVEDFHPVNTDARFTLICQLWPLWGPCPLHVSKPTDRRGVIEIVKTILPQPQRRFVWMGQQLEATGK